MVEYFESVNEYRRAERRLREREFDLQDVVRHTDDAAVRLAAETFIDTVIPNGFDGKGAGRTQQIESWVAFALDPDAPAPYNVIRIKAKRDAWLREQGLDSDFLPMRPVRTRRRKVKPAKPPKTTGNR